jgi:hypothetical protein
MTFQYKIISPAQAVIMRLTGSTLRMLPLTANELDSPVLIAINGEHIHDHQIRSMNFAKVETRILAIDEAQREWPVPQIKYKGTITGRLKKEKNWIPKKYGK